VNKNVYATFFPLNIWSVTIKMHVVLMLVSKRTKKFFSIVSTTNFRNLVCIVVDGIIKIKI